MSGPAEAGNTGSFYGVADQPVGRALRMKMLIQRLRLSSWYVDFTIILVFWTSDENQGCQASWRGGATLGSASRQDVRSCQVQRR